MHGVARTRRALTQQHKSNETADLSLEIKQLLEEAEHKQYRCGRKPPGTNSANSARPRSTNHECIGRSSASKKKNIGKGTDNGRALSSHLLDEVVGFRAQIFLHMLFKSFIQNRMAHYNLCFKYKRERARRCITFVKNLSVRFEHALCTKCP